jgi:putative addiction module killer protein
MNIDIAYLEAGNGKSPYLEWEKKLDISTRAVVRSRMNRVRLGNFGDFHAIKGVPGLYEFRICLGPGYRIYFGKIKDTVVIILCGGDIPKKPQDLAARQRQSLGNRRS